MEYKVLPHDIEAEKNILSAIIIKNDLMSEIIGALKPTDFYSSANIIIYEKMISMYSKSIAIDIITLTNSMNKDTLISIGGVTYLSEIAATSITRIHFKHYINLVRTLSHKRQIIKSCQNALQNAYNEECEPRKIIDELQSGFISMDDIDEEGTVNAGELMESTINMIEANYKRGGGITGISTGYPSLDNATNGFIKKDLYIIAARPSMGKTALVMNLVSKVPKAFNVATFELEMSKEKLGVRLLAQLARTDSKALARGQVNENEFPLVLQRAAEVSKKNNIYTNCRAGLSVAEIKAECKKIKIQHGLDIVIIDHLGKVKPLNLKASRNDQVGQITEELKNMAKELDVCVVLLSQLNRQCEMRADKRPQLSDLRDSGNIEQDADCIMFLYRDDYYAEREGKQSDKPGVLEILIGKNRDGEVGLIELTYKAEYQIITEIPRR